MQNCEKVFYPYSIALRNVCVVSGTTATDETDAFEPLAYFIRQQVKFYDGDYGDTHAAIGVYCNPGG
jgi:hypothetical protein